MKNDIIENVSNTILISNSDLLIDIGEIGIDYVFDKSPLIELPLVKTMYSVIKTGICVRDRHLLNKTLIFIKNLEDNNIDSKEYEKYKTKLSEKDKFYRI